ncbi:MAG: type VI secretion system protein TssA [Azoarcus sp.]|jgi:type VI secretion system protein ImpA|nr:type VI secretion system protein TssA [Azoarcus sp.]
MDSIFSPALLETVDHTVGEDLEYTSAFAEFTVMAAPRAERQVGNHIIPAQAPDWGDVFKTGSALLEKSRDLRILAKVCQAALQKYGLPGLAQALSLMAQWIEREWDYLYPQLSIDGDYDPLFRCNAISEIADREGLVTALRQTALLETPIGTAPISSVESLLDGKPVEEAATISSLDQLARIIVEEKTRNRERLDAIASISSALNTIVSTFKARLEPEYWPNLDLLNGIVSRIERFVAPLVQDAPTPSETEPGQATPSSSNTTGAVAVSATALPAKLNTRAEAFKALALARQYFENNEPSHPAPLLIRRVERLTELDFSAIVKNLLPDGLQQLRILVGETEEPDS